MCVLYQGFIIIVICAHYRDFPLKGQPPAEKRNRQLLNSGVTQVLFVYSHMYESACMCIIHVCELCWQLRVRYSTLRVCLCVCVCVCVCTDDKSKGKGPVESEGFINALSSQAAKMKEKKRKVSKVSAC